jgi:hypothetical protein
MNRHLDKQKDIPELKKEAALASTKAKKMALKNKAILAERDVEFGKVLEGRVAQIEEHYEVSIFSNTLASPSIDSSPIRHSNDNGRNSLRRKNGLLKERRKKPGVLQLQV